MKAPDVSRAITAARSIAESCGLRADDATVLQNSNKLGLRLSPCEAFARVAHVGQEVAEFEIALARGLAQFEGCPVAALDPRVEPRVYQQDGFAVTLWTYYGPASPDVEPADYADALARLHVAMCEISLPAPHFTDRVAEAEQLTTSPELSPDLTDVDRELVTTTLRVLRRSIGERGAPEQLLHGEPHRGNLLGTESGPRFIDLETCCHGPVEFDLAHVPVAVGDRYPGTDPALLDDCRGLVLAMVAAWRWDRDDEFPDGRRAGRELLRALRHGPPWPALDAVMPD